MVYTFIDHSSRPISERVFAQYVIVKNLIVIIIIIIIIIIITIYLFI